MIERKASIFNIQKYNMHDGPGVRTLVFFQGCPLRCLWCSNPEGQLKEPQLLFKAHRCVNCGACAAVCPQGIHALDGQGRHRVDRDLACIGCRACAAACPQGALAIVGEQKTISELVQVIEEDKPFYDLSGGGVTLGGGEVLMQPEAATSLLMACRQQGIHTAIETCGYARAEVVHQVAQWTDLFLFDVKHMDGDVHRRLTGVRNETILSNLRWLLDNRHAVRIRVPLVQGMNDGAENIEALVRFLESYQDYGNFKGVDLLPYHKMGVAKYDRLGWTYPLDQDFRLGDEALETIAAVFDRHGLPVSIVHH